MSLNPTTKKMYITLSVVIVILAAAGIGVIYPYYGKISTLKKEMYDARLQLAIFQQQRDNAEATRQDYNRIKNDIENISKIFINKDKVIDFISSLESIAGRRNVRQTINLDTTTQDSTDGTLDMKISVDGSWADCLQYLADLERLDYYLSISELNATGEANNINLALTAQAFTQ